MIDLSASWTATGLGHAHPDAVLLAQELCERVEVVAPVGERRTYLGHAGTDANDVALRSGRHLTGRRGVVAFEGGYHGGLGGSQSVSGIHISGGVAADLARVEAALTDDSVAAVLVERSSPTAACWCRRTGSWPGSAR